MSKLLQPKRILICTLVALGSGFFSSYIGGQINLKVRTHSCQTQPWGLKQVCNVAVAPQAIWQGSITGLWMGTILGAFIAGLATHQSSQDHLKSNANISAKNLTKATNLCADELKLTPEQKEALNYFLILLVLKLGTSNDNAGENNAPMLSLDELQYLATIAGLNSSFKQKLSGEVVEQLMLKLALDNRQSIK